MVPRLGRVATGLVPAVATPSWYQLVEPMAGFLLRVYRDIDEDKVLFVPDGVVFPPRWLDEDEVLEDGWEIPLDGLAVARIRVIPTTYFHLLDADTQEQAAKEEWSFYLDGGLAWRRPTLEELERAGWGDP